DDLYPTPALAGSGAIGQQNEYGYNASSTNVPFGGILLTNGLVLPPTSFLGLEYLFIQPFSGFPNNLTTIGGASGLHFTAVAGVTYHIAVDSKQAPFLFIPSTGPFVLNWAYHSSGVFRFASENIDQTTGVPG